MSKEKEKNSRSLGGHRACCAALRPPPWILDLEWGTFVNRMPTCSSRFLLFGNSTIRLRAILAPYGNRLPMCRGDRALHRDARGISPLQVAHQRPRPILPEGPAQLKAMATSYVRGKTWLSGGGGGGAARASKEKLQRPSGSKASTITSPTGFLPQVGGEEKTSIFTKQKREAAWVELLGTAHCLAPLPPSWKNGGGSILRLLPGPFRAGSLFSLFLLSAPNTEEASSQGKETGQEVASTNQLLSYGVHTRPALSSPVPLACLFSPSFRLPNHPAAHSTPLFPTLHSLSPLS